MSTPRHYFLTQEEKRGTNKGEGTNEKEIRIRNQSESSTHNAAFSPQTAVRHFAQKLYESAICMMGRQVS